MKRMAMTLFAPVAVFVLLHVLAVQPQRAAASAAQQQVDDLTARLNHRRTFLRTASVDAEASPLRQFEARTSDGDRAQDVADAIAAIVTGPAVGGVANLSIETGGPGDDPQDPRIGLFSRQLAHTRVVVAFDARYEQIGRFFWNLRTLPTTFELRSVELTPDRAPSIHAHVVLFVFHRKVPTEPRPTATQPLLVDAMTGPPWSEHVTAYPEPRPTTPTRREGIVPPQPDPIVSTILISNRQRVALVDGQIVRVGDRVGSMMVRAIEPDAVVIVTSGGQSRHLVLERPVIRIARR